MRRITADQYRQTIADVFAPEIKVTGRFEPDSRQNGLLAVGTAWVSITPAGFEQYDAMARRIAEQVLDPGAAAALRPLSTREPRGARREMCGRLRAQVRASPAAAPARRGRDRESRRPRGGGDEADGRFPCGPAGRAREPARLARIPLPRRTGGRGSRVIRTSCGSTDFSLASRLSHFLWNTTPDEALLLAAERGALSTDEGLAREVDRLLASPRLEAGVRAYFSDLLGFDGLEDVSKDTLVYPRFSRQILEDAREQTLRVVADHLVARRADYRELFTTRNSFMTRNLGLVYGVPVRAREGFEAMTFPADSPRVGLQSHVSVLALHAHPGRSSPTLRGIFVREALLCTEIPAAPANVDFTVVQDVANPDLKTARERLEAHRTEAACESCHRLVDPVGLALEPFDGSGMFRDDGERGRDRRPGRARRQGDRGTGRARRGASRQRGGGGLRRSRALSVCARARARARRAGVRARARRALRRLGVPLLRSDARDRDERVLPHDLGSAGDA